MKGARRRGSEEGASRSSGARRRRRANSRTCFTNCHLKATNRGTAAPEKRVQGPATDCAGMYSPPRRCITVAWANAQTNRISLDAGTGSNKCGVMGTSKAPASINASSKSVLFSCLPLFISKTQPVCAQEKQNKAATFQDIAYVEVFVTH